MTPHDYQQSRYMALCDLYRECSGKKPTDIQSAYANMQAWQETYEKFCTLDSNTLYAAMLDAEIEYDELALQRKKDLLAGFNAMLKLGGE